MSRAPRGIFTIMLLQFAANARLFFPQSEEVTAHSGLVYRHPAEHFGVRSNLLRETTPRDSHAYHQDDDRNNLSRI